MAKRVIYVEVDANLAPYLEKIARAQSELVKFGATSDRVGAGVRKNASDMDILATSFKRFGAIAAASGLTGLVVGLGKAVIEVDRLNIAMQNITESTRGYAKSQQFLNSLTNDYGQAMVSTQRNYNQFIASSNASNLSLESRQKIFQSIIKAGSALQLSNYSMEKSLYAVNQMFSKNAVQAEELRQQLGDHLPGAMSLMAQALGVSENALMGMMKKGLVPATEALPKFAALLEELYGSTAARNLETVSGAWNRLYNSVIKAAVGVNEQYGVTKALAAVLNDVASNLSTYSQGISLVIAGVVAYKVAVLALNAAMALWNRYAVQSTAIEITKLSAIRASAAATAAATAATTGYTAATGAATIATRALSFAMAAIPIIAAIAAIALLASHFSEYNDQITEANKLQSDISNTTKSYTESTNRLNSRLQSLTNIINSTTASVSMKEEAFKSLQKIFPEQFRNMETYAGNEAKVKAAIDQANKSIEQRIRLLSSQARAEVYMQKAADSRSRLTEIEEEIPRASTEQRLTAKDLAFLANPNIPLAGRVAASLNLKRSDRERLEAERKATESALNNYTSMLEAEEKKILEMGGRIGEALGNIPPDGPEKNKGKSAEEWNHTLQLLSNRLKDTKRDVDELTLSYVKNFNQQEKISKSDTTLYDRYKKEEESLSGLVKLHKELIAWRGKTTLQAEEDRLTRSYDLQNRFGSNIVALGKGDKSAMNNTLEADLKNSRSSTSALFEKHVKEVKEDGARAITEHIVMSLGDVWATAFESIFNKDINFGSAMKKMLGDFMKGLGQIVVRMGAAILATSKLKTIGETAIAAFGGGTAGIGAGLAMIALGGALMGGGSAISASASKSASTGGVAQSASSGTYGSGFSYGSTPKVQVSVTGDFRIKGTDLVGVIKNTNNVYK